MNKFNNCSSRKGCSRDRQASPISFWSADPLSRKQNVHKRVAVLNHIYVCLIIYLCTVTGRLLLRSSSWEYECTHICMREGELPGVNYKHRLKRRGPIHHSRNSASQDYLSPVFNFNDFLYFKRNLRENRVFIFSMRHSLILGWMCRLSHNKKPPTPPIRLGSPHHTSSNRPKPYRAFSSRIRVPMLALDNVQYALNSIQKVILMKSSECQYCNVKTSKERDYAEKLLLTASDLEEVYI
jgi:hypothetical protein